MRTPLVLIALLVLAGCAGTAPVSPTPPPPPPEVVPPEPEPVSVVEPPQIVEVEPVEPPPVPELRIDRRSVFERAGVTEWTLANGLTVVFQQVSEAEGYHARVEAPVGSSRFSANGRGAFVRGDGPSWGAMSAQIEGFKRVATGSADGLQGLLGDVVRLLTAPPDRGGGVRAGRQFEVTSYTRVYLLGPLGHEWVEPAVATTLGALRGERDALVATADFDPAPWVRVDWGDLPAVRVLDRALADRSGPEAGLRYEAGSQRVYLRSDGETPRPVLLAAFSDDALRAARDRAAAEARSPAARLEALAALYGLPGEFRPARDPFEATALPGRIARTPPSAPADLLRRLSEAR